MDEHLTSNEPAVADLLRALSEPAYTVELAGEKHAVAAFTSAVKEKEKAQAAQSEKGRRPLRHAMRGAKLAAAAMVGSLVMGGVAAAAVTGSLPGPFQDVAHKLGAPAAASDDPTTEPTGSESPEPSASPSASGTHRPGSDLGRGHGPSVFAVCWYVVHKTNGAAGGPGAVQLPTTAPSALPTDGTDPSDVLDHGNGAWSQAYARIRAAAGAQGQSVLDYCTAQVVAAGKGGHSAGKAKGKGNADQGKGSSSGKGREGNGKGKGHGSGDSSGAGSSGSSGDGSSGDSSSGHGGHGSSGDGSSGDGSSGDGSSGHGSGSGH